MKYVVLKHPSQEVYRAYNTGSLDYIEYISLGWTVIFSGTKHDCLNLIQNFEEGN